MLSRSNNKDKLFYGWVVVAAFFVVGVILFGIHQSFGLFFKSIASDFNFSRAATSAIVSVNLIMAGVFGLAAGWAIDKYGPKTVVLLMGIFAGLSLLLTSQTESAWQLFITYSLLLSIGTGALYVVPTSTISRWFIKRRGVALGFTLSGQGVGMIVMAPVIAYLISHLNWRLAYIILGLVAWLIVIPASRFLKRDPSEINAIPDGSNLPPQHDEERKKSSKAPDISILYVFKTRSLWLILSIWMVIASSLFLVLTHLVPHATDLGFSTDKAASLIGLIGASGILGRILMGLMSDKIGRKLTPLINALLMAGSMFSLIWANELWILSLFAVVFGFAYSGISSSMGALIGDIFGLARIGSIFGVLEIGWGIGAAIGPAMGGVIFDLNSSYSEAFLISAFSLLMSSILIIFIKKEAI